LTSKTKKQTEVASGLYQPVVALWLPRKTHPIHGPDCFTSRPNDKKQKFPAEPQPGMCQLCYLRSHTYMHSLCKEGRKNRKSNDEKGGEQA